MALYTSLLRPMLFRVDPEKVHNLALRTGSILGSTGISRALRPFYVFEDKMLETEVCAIRFKNPIGLAAGFDKNAALPAMLGDIGFGFAELGSVTASPCKGNPKPRLWRLPKDQSIVVHYGLANEGAEKISRKLVGEKFRIPIGISIAKTNSRVIKGEESVNDYCQSFKLFEMIGDYITINISCPNTGDGRSFEDSQMLDRLLKKINNKDRVVFLKVSNDLSLKNMNEIVSVVKKYKVDGFVISNLRKKREGLKSPPEKIAAVKGGLSGAPTRQTSTELIRHVYKKTRGKYAIIGVGGVFTAQDAYEKITAGASLIQLITGMIYRGPGVIKEINQGLVKLLKKDGLKNIKEAVGKDVS